MGTSPTSTTRPFLRQASKARFRRPASPPAAVTITPSAPRPSVRSSTPATKSRSAMVRPWPRPRACARATRSARTSTPMTTAPAALANSRDHARARVAGGDLGGDAGADEPGRAAQPVARNPLHDLAHQGRVADGLEHEILAPAPAPEGGRLGTRADQGMARAHEQRSRTDDGLRHFHDPDLPARHRHLEHVGPLPERAPLPERGILP